MNSSRSERRPHLNGPSAAFPAHSFPFHIIHRIEVLSLWHSLVVLAAFAGGLLAEILFRDDPRVSKGWLSIPLHISYWLRCGFGVVSLSSARYCPFPALSPFFDEASLRLGFPSCCVISCVDHYTYNMLDITF